MNLKSRLAAILLALMLGSAVAVAQEAETGDNVVSWTARIEPVGEGAEVDVVFETPVRAGWIVYAPDFKPAEIGPRPARVTLSSKGLAKAVGTPVSVGAASGQGKEADGGHSYTYFSGKATIRQRVRPDVADKAVNGVLSGQSCYEKTGLCTLFRHSFALSAPAAS
ncbi:MAG: disulfide bond formation protein DsbD [Steroidobacteraceae bacterium]